MTLGSINKVIPFSLVDGPGSRFVIFFQGCNFDCIACHNPYTITECTHCQVCVEPCPEGALSVDDDGKVVVDWTLCTECDVCIGVCPENSTPLARTYSVASLVDEIRAATPFIRGVTVSGGEATLQTDFLVELFSAIREDPDLRRLSILVDSNGSASPSTWNRLIPVIDGAMIDLKALDPEEHHRLTARGNEAVLSTIRHLADADRLTEVRVLAMHGYNTSEQAARRTRQWLDKNAPGVPVKVLGYRHAGVRSEGLHVPETTPLEIRSLRAALI